MHASTKSLVQTATEYVQQCSGTADADRFINRVGPDQQIESVRRRADQTSSAIARSGRFRFTHWSVLLLIVGASLVGAAAFIATAALPLGVTGALCIASGIVGASAYDPKPASRHLELFCDYVESADADWRQSARRQSADRTAAITAAVEAVPGAAPGGGWGLRELSAGCRAAAATANWVSADLESRAAVAAAAAATAEEDLRRRLADFRARTRTWAARLRGGQIRRRGGLAVETAENLVSKRRSAESLLLARQSLAEVKAALDRLLGTLDRDGIHPLMAMADDARKAADDLLRQGSRGPFGSTVPVPEKIASGARMLFEPRTGDLCRAVVARQEGIAIAGAVETEVRAVLERTPIGPSDLTQYAAELNGTAEGAFSQLNDEAAELAVSRPTPGRIPRRLRAVLTHGGANSPLTKAIAQRSVGCVVRGIDLDDPSQLIQVVESRFEPGSELVEIAEAARSLALLSDEAKAAMVTAVAVHDREQVLTLVRPEERTEAGRGLRLLVLGLSLGLLVRRRSVYEAAGAVASHGNGVLGRSFEEAEENAGAESPLAKRLREAIESAITERGAEAAGRAIREAIGRTALVPAEHLARARAALEDELESLRKLG